jgi:hypothetical protein
MLKLSLLMHYYGKCSVVMYVGRSSIVAAWQFLGGDKISLGIGLAGVLAGCPIIHSN